MYNNDLTANSQKFEASYQNGKYGFMINNTFYEIGGDSSMKSKVAYSGAFTNMSLTIDLSSIGVSVDNADDYYILVECTAYVITGITKTSTEFTITRTSASSTPNIVVQIIYSAA